MTTRLWRSLALVFGLGLLVLAACVPTAENPIAVPGGTPDPALVGAWRGTLEEGDIVYLHFLRGRNDTLKAVLITSETDSARQDATEGAWAVFTLITAEVAGTRYISALFDYDDGEAVTGQTRGYHLLRYKIDDDGTLRMFQVDDDALARAIEEKKLAGSVERNQLTTDVRVTAPSAALVAYLKTIDPKTLFNRPFAALTRID